MGNKTRGCSYHNYSQFRELIIVLISYEVLSILNSTFSMAMQRFASLFRNTPAVIGMIHVGALPGTPLNIDVC